MFSIHKKPVASVSAPHSNPPQTQTKPAVTFSSAPPPSSSPLQTVAQDLAKVRLLSPLGVSSFSFPYTAYPIQNDLMRAIYTCIKTRRVGVFESPTGTGKTLSVICSTLTFLKEQYQLGDDDDDDDNSNSIQQGAVGGGGGGGQHFKYSRPSTPVDDDEPDWCLNFESERSSTVKALTLKRAKAFRDTLSEKLEQLRLTTDSRIGGLTSNGIAISGGGGGGVSLGPPRVSKAERRARYLRLRQSQTQTGLGTKISSSIKRERDDDRSDSDGFGADKNVVKIATRENGDLIGEDMDIHLLPPEYHSDEDEDLRAEAIATSVSATVGIADRIREQVARERATQTPQIDEEEDIEEAAAFRPKIIFVSRTHSQISQFVREISKTAFGKTVRVVALGSRSTLCVNPEVVDLPTDARVNERCLELQDEARAGSSISGVTPGTGKGSKKQPNQGDISTGKNTINTLSTVSDTNTSKLTSASNTTGKGGSKGCPFIDTASQEMFRDRLLAGLRDVEEAAELGWTAGTCAYYGSRKAVKYAEVVAMPYSMLLHSGTRTAAGIEPHLKGSVVIIDEAHNIIDAINSTHAALVTHQQLVIAAATVKEYLTKYKSRMKGSNVAHCTMLAEAFQSLALYLKPVSSTTLSSSSSSSSSSSAPTFSATSVPKGSSPNTDSLLPLVSSRLVSFSHEGGGGKGFAPISASCSPPISRPDSPFAVSVSVSTIAAQMASESLILSSTTTAPTTPTFSSITLPISRSISPLHNTPRTYTTNSSLPGSTVATSSRGGGVVVGGSYGHGLQTDSQLLFSPVIAPPPPVSSHATSALRPIPLASFTSTIPPILLHNNINAPSTLSSTSVIAPTTTTSAIAPAPTPALPNSSVHTVSDFLASSGITLANPTSSSSITSTNLFKVRRYVETVDLLKKLRGFAEAGARAAAAVAASEVTIHTHAKKHQKGPQQQQQQQHQSHTMSETSVMSSSGGVQLDDITTTNSSSNISLLPTSQSYMASVTAIQTAYNFLCCLMGADCDGRVVVNRLGIDLNTTRGGGGGGGGDATTSSSSTTTTTTTTTAQPFFKFVLLNPAVPFLRVVQDARSVVLVGGTMQPISDITDQLFGHLPLNRVMTFSCGHVIPSENLSAFTVSKGPTGIAFDFRHATRSSPIMIAELGRALVNLSALIPSGLVVFMPSYDYLRSALSVWSKPTQQSQQLQQNTSNISTQGGGGGGLQSHTQLPGSLPQALPGSVLAMLQKKKKVFAEPKSSSDVDAVLRAYTSAIRTPNQTQSGHVHHGLTSAGSTIQPSSLNKSDTEFEFDTSTSLHSTSRHTSRPSSRPPSRTGTGVEGGGGVFLDTVSDEHMINSSTHMTIESSIPVSKQTTSGGGALLFCVVGGKMSEGINFSDDLARGVAVVGLPYPNPSDPELVERMAYLDRRAAVAASSQSSQMNTSSILPLVSGREYYENITIRAVNQAIGRSIRHANDYAVIVLLDGRYSQHRIKSKLPGWIGERLQTQGVGGGVGDVTSWGPCAAGIGSFFRKKASASAL